MKDVIFFANRLLVEFLKTLAFVALGFLLIFSMYSLCVSEIHMIFKFLVISILLHGLLFVFMAARIF